jgi:hypothetical protein
MNEAKFGSRVSHDPAPGDEDRSEAGSNDTSAEASARAGRESLFDLLADYVRDNPKIAAAIAFQVGIAAAMLTRTAGRRIGRDGVPSSLVRLRDAVVPALTEMTSLFSAGAVSPSRRKARRKPATRRASRKTAGRRRRAA